MVNYLKNFVIKLFLLPILIVLGGLLLAAFVVLPQFKLIGQKTNSRRIKHGRKEKSQDYEAFY